jgi:hypothetical protein
MQIRTRNTGETVTVDVIDSTDGAIPYTYDIPAGSQIVVNSPTASSPANIEVGEVEAIPADAPPATPEGSGTAEGGAEAPAAEGGEQPTEGTTPPAEGAGQPEPTTSEASEKPLYTLAGEAPEGFVPSGLDTPDGATLYHYAGDTAGEAHTADVGVEGLDLYAEADDNTQPVVVATADGTDGAAA